MAFEFATTKKSNCIFTEFKRGLISQEYSLHSNMADSLSISFETQSKYLEMKLETSRNKSHEL